MAYQSQAFPHTPPGFRSGSGQPISQACEPSVRASKPSPMETLLPGVALEATEKTVGNNTKYNIYGVGRGSTVSQHINALLEQKRAVPERRL